MIDRLQLPFSFSPDALAADLASLDGSAWIEHFVKGNFEGDWSAMALRMPQRAVGMNPVASLFSHWGEDGWVNTPLLEACPAFRAVVETFQCPLAAVRLMRLATGSVIKEHCDPDLAFEDGCVRLHVPVQTNPQVEFYLNHQRVVMAVGECWYLRLSDPHRVSNPGPCDRIHLVIDAEVNPWLEEVFRASASVAG